MGPATHKRPIANNQLQLHTNSKPDQMSAQIRRSQVATPERSDAKAARMDRSAARGQREKALRDEAVAWVTEHLPESKRPGRGWFSYAVGAAIPLLKERRELNVPAVKKRMAEMWPYLPDWINESKGAK